MSALPDALRDTLEQHLGTSIEDCATVSGGCIANASRLQTTDDAYFLKWGDDEVARTFPGEAAGLGALRASDAEVVVPEVVTIVEEPDGAVPGFIVMEWIDTGRKGRHFWNDFGAGLAEVHRHTADAYGFDRDNHIGQLPQHNDWMEDWPDFFRAQRLEPQVQMARDRGRWADDWNDPLDALYRRLPDLLPAEPEPSVLHGDLWSGNYMVTSIGLPALIDPATYYGHREADLAMTELFGGFERPFYDAYRDAWPLEPGYDTRKEVYNLYHLINHLNHFGQSYARQVATTLRGLA